MDERDRVSSFDCDHNPRGSPGSRRDRIRARIKHLKTLPWSFEVEDELYHLRHAISVEMGVPHYMRI